MRLSFAFIILVSAVVAVSAGIYPTKTGSKGTGYTKGGSDDGKQQDDRFHLQSPDGQYVFGHTSGNQGRTEMRDKNGTVTGYYSYVGGNGKMVYVNYIADKEGYRVLSNTGVPSASVTIEGSVDKKMSHTENDFQKVFSDFTKRIKDKVVEKIGQKAVDPIGERQYQVTVDPIFYPTKETKHSNHEENNSFPDWNQVTTSTTQKPTDGIKYDEGQQQQEIVDPNWENVKITTQRSNIKKLDNDDQVSNDNDWKTSTDYAIPTPIPLVPYQPQVPTERGYSDIVSSDDHVQEITEDPISKIETESTVIDDIQNNSPVTKSISPGNDVQTTVSYYDRPGPTVVTEESISRGDSNLTIADVRQFDKSSTVAITESATELVTKENEEKLQIPLETDELTTIRPLDKEESFENVQATEHPSRQADFETTEIVSDVDYTTMKTAIDSTSPVYAPTITIFQPKDKIDDTETTTSDIQYVTEENKDDSIEFRTLEPNKIIETTINPNDRQSDAEIKEITWPEIPQEAVPQVLIPLDPYPDYSRTKNAGIKTKITYLRPLRHLDEVKTTANVSEIEITTHINGENTTSFNFPTYYITG